MSNQGSEFVWKTVFDAAPMAAGMPSHFLLYLLNEQPLFVRFGKLATASLWLQSQMAGAIAIDEDANLKNLINEEHGKHFPTALAAAAAKKLENLSSESLRTSFINRFGHFMTSEIQSDLRRVILARDALAHGYLSLFRQIIGPEPDAIIWQPRSSGERKRLLQQLVGHPLSDEGAIMMSLSEDAFAEQIGVMCRIMDFIASLLKRWGGHYPVFA